MITNKIIGNNICAERNRLRLSQEEVAKKMGVSRDVYCNIENNRKIISAVELFKLCTIFNCNINAFYLLPIITNREEQYECK